MRKVRRPKITKFFYIILIRAQSCRSLHCKGKIPDVRLNYPNKEISTKGSLVKNAKDRFEHEFRD